MFVSFFFFPGHSCRRPNSSTETAAVRAAAAKYEPQITMQLPGAAATVAAAAAAATDPLLFDPTFSNILSDGTSNLLLTRSWS